MKLTTTNRILLCAAAYLAMFLTGKYLVWPQKPEALPPEPVPAAETTAAPPALTTAAPAQTTGTAAAQSTTASSAVTGSASALPAETTLSAPDTDTAARTENSTTAASTTLLTTTTAELTTELTTTQVPPPPGTLTQAPDGYFSDALFIGDSRTVGQAYYGPIEGAAYFASTGMSTANIYKSTSETDPTKGMTFEAVMSARQYGKIYIMMGINELGNDRTATINNFAALLDRIKAAQPNAIIYIEANLHVTAARSQQNVYGVNNTEINKYNASLSDFADNETVYYLDVNPIFDDASGALRAETTGDGVHPQAEHYLTWREWLMQNVIIR